MKKSVVFAFAALLVAPLFAQESSKAGDGNSAKAESHRRVSDQWPAFFAFFEYPACPDVVGLRLTIPFSTRQENVTGLDLGLWGRSMYFEGIQLNIVRNDVTDAAAGIQVGLYNSIGSGDMFNIQVGLWNEANSVRGFQVGLVNVAGEAQGFQVGIVNRSETMHGYQVGLINVIRDAELEFFPVLNIGF